MKPVQVSALVKGGRGRGRLVKFAGSVNWISCYYASDGKEHRESTRTSDEKVALRIHKAKLDQIASERQGHGPLLLPAQKRVTVNELLDALEADQSLRGLKSAGKAAAHAKPIRSAFGTWRAVDVTAEAVDKYIKARKVVGLSNATINRSLQTLIAAFNLAVRRRTLTTAPVIRKLSEVGNARKGFFEREEFEKVLAQLPDYLQDAARFAYVTGWRKSEVVALRWEWVDLVAGRIVLPDSKNGQGRALAIAGELTELFKRREAARLVELRSGGLKVADLVFHRRSRPLGDFKRAWHKALTEAGFSELVKRSDGSVRTVYTRTFHDFRRTAARNLVRAGVREGVAMSVTGHRTRSIFDRYNITSAEDLRAAMEALT